MLINADLHIHSPFSGGTASRIDLKKVAMAAKKKGLHVVGSGDCLHPVWQNELKKYLVGDKIVVDGVHFILSCEVEDKNRVHHLLLFPDFYSANAFKERMEKYSPDIEDEGRPKIMLEGGEILDVAKEVNALIGAAHAFTPWTSLYAYFDSLLEYYGGKPHFIELGLSADSDYADRIKELHDIPFLSNSDAHSYSPHRLGREFNRLEVNEISWEEIRKAILNGGIKANIGFPPEKGKYNRTACSWCHRQYEKDEAAKIGWRCFCGGVIKKGVRDRVNELASYEKPIHPPFRPPYIHLIPLAEIIAESLGKDTSNGIVAKRWRELMKLGSEIEVLLDIDMEKIKKITPLAIAEAIEAFREGKIKIIPGGGGKYGEIVIT